MSDTVSREEAFRRLAARCSSKECCVWEVREKMRNWNVFRVDEDSVVEQLLAENYIDEARYCRAFTNDKFRFDGWGRIKISYTLRQKSIDSLTVSQSLQCIDEEEYYEALMKLLKSKMRSLKSLPPHEQCEKLMRFATSRGFEPYLISECLKELSPQCEIASETGSEI